MRRRRVREDTEEGEKNGKGCGQERKGMHL